MGLLQNEFRGVFEELAHPIGERSQPDGSEKVDGVAGLAHVVGGEEFLVPFRLFGIGRLEAFLETGHPQRFGHFLYEDLEEDATGRRCLVLVEVDGGQDTPRQSVSVQQVCKEFGHIPELVRFEAMDGAVLLHKGVGKGLPPSLGEVTEPPGNHPVMSLKGLFLRATLDEHVDELVFATSRDVEFGQFVRRFFKAGRRHDGQIDETAQVDQFGFGQILYHQRR